MATLWLLLSVSVGVYNKGTVTSVEFSSYQNCFEAVQELQRDSEVNRNTKLFCVKK
ncbi:hypothetical protein G5211_00227 [Escherichia phage vB_EcoM_G5211]|nr:hypothetical protein G2494_00236 [Escherichia phage vB_EcoM_G2494]QBO66468.1 hypothetical protein G5211_00227 [Escherichia phage vB_EcoM_G5211]